MSAAWDDNIDAATERARDERLLASLSRGLADSAAGRVTDLGSFAKYAVSNRCDGCGQECDVADYVWQDGHGPDCPHGDLGCDLRVCDPRNDDPANHSACETQADRDSREAREWAEALRDEETDRVIAERREGDR
ncbi:MAG: hypothetical protein NVSMB4_07320 [Acidimicrobiales bacterium]